MKKEQTIKEWASDYREFLNSPEKVPPVALSEKLLSKVRHDLSPSPWKVFGKLGGITVLTGSLSLLLCPQFGIGAPGYSGLMDYFMQLGPNWCGAACGAFFSVTAVLASLFILGLEEIRVLRRTEALQFAALSALVYAVFVCAGARILATFSLLWLLGAFIGAVCTFEIGCSFRFRKVTAP